MDLSHTKYLFRKAARTLRKEGPKELLQASVRFVRNNPRGGLDPTGRDPRWLEYFDIGSGDTVIDAGGCVGIFSELASRHVGEKGQVYTIEPVPQNLEEIYLRLGDRGNVQVIEAAVMDYRGMGTISISPEKRGANTLVDDLDERGYETYDHEVNVITLDDLYEREELSDVDLLQMDIEGAEIKALSGAQCTLENTDKVIVEANHPAGDAHDGKTSEVVKALLEDAGFNAWIGDGEIVYGLNVERFRSRMGQ